MKLVRSRQKITWPFLSLPIRRLMPSWLHQLAMLLSDNGLVSQHFGRKLEPLIETDPRLPSCHATYFFRRENVDRNIPNTLREVNNLRMLPWHNCLDECHDFKNTLSCIRADIPNECCLCGMYGVLNRLYHIAYVDIVPDLLALGNQGEGFALLDASEI